MGSEGRCTTFRDDGQSANVQVIAGTLTLIISKGIDDWVSASRYMTVYISGLRSISATHGGGLGSRPQQSWTPESLKVIWWDMTKRR